jgi:hypothetical protein
LLAETAKVDKALSFVSDLPNVPAVYALYGGRGRSVHVAYVGIADALRRRIDQHLIKRDSSVATGTSAVCLNPDYVSQVRWWEHPDFSDRAVLEAAELVAFDLFEPALRSRGGITDRAKQLYGDESFLAKMQALFAQAPTGQLVILTLPDVVERLAELEDRLRRIEELLDKRAGSPATDKAVRRRR